MKIELHKLERMSIEDFADIHGLTMEVHERYTELGIRYFASFRPLCEVKQGAVLCSESGRGKTVDEAIKDYACIISGEILVFGATSGNRREIPAPILFYKGGNQ